MKKGSWFDQQVGKVEGTPSFETERLLISITEALVGRLIELDLKKSDLARAMNVDRSIVTRALSGDQNMTVRTMVSMALALGCRVRVELEDIKAEENRHTIAWTTAFSSKAPVQEPSTTAAEISAAEAFRKLVKSALKTSMTKNLHREKPDGRPAAAA